MKIKKKNYILGGGGLVQVKGGGRGGIGLGVRVDVNGEVKFL